MHSDCDIPEKTQGVQKCGVCGLWNMYRSAAHLSAHLALKAHAVLALLLRLHPGGQPQRPSVQRAAAHLLRSGLRPGRAGNGWVKAFTRRTLRRDLTPVHHKTTTHAGCRFQHTPLHSCVLVLHCSSGKAPWLNGVQAPTSCGTGGLSASGGQLAKRSQRSAPGRHRSSATTRGLLSPNRSAPVLANALHQQHKNECQAKWSGATNVLQHILVKTRMWTGTPGMGVAPQVTCKLTYCVLHTPAYLNASP